MWINGNYRRIFLDAHLDDWHDDFMSQVNPEQIVATLKAAGAQNIVVKAKPHTGLCNWPSTIGKMHRGLKGRDYVGEMIQHCHQNGVAVIVYYSQIFDNWAYDRHPAWRVVYPDGMTSKERTSDFFKQGRYGMVCPNNAEYRQYVKANLQELSSSYAFEGMFLDMAFWQEVCYCASCKERYLHETGKEMPRIVDWSNPDWLAFQDARDRWMGEFTAFSTSCIKEINKDITVEHNFSSALSPWQLGHTDLVIEACDYAGGDYYGGYLQQTFCCKYYNNVSPHLPFSYITSRCDPNLLFHTTTKTKEEFVLHAITALVHNGAFSLCDGMNPDGTINHDVYMNVIKAAFDETRKYEQYVSGDMLSSVAVWMPTYAKFDSGSNGLSVKDAGLSGEYMNGQIRMTALLRDHHVPFSVVASKNLNKMTEPVAVVSNVARIRDDEMIALEAYVNKGGNLYMSGNIGHGRLYELLEMEDLGWTDDQFTYMSPTEAGSALFGELNARNPLSVDGQQRRVKVSGNCEVLATITLPYSPVIGERFAAIHSNPPGVPTEHPAIVLKRIGNGSIMWLAAPIEKLKSYMSKKVVLQLLEHLHRERAFFSNAPSFIEIVGWEKEGKCYYAAINQQEEMPVYPIHDIYIELPRIVREARLLESDEGIAVEFRDGSTRIKLPPVELFHIIEVSWK